MAHRFLALPGALLALLLTAPAAQALPVFSMPLEPCYATAGTAAEPQGEAVKISATGFTPNAKVDLTLDGHPVPGGNALQTDAGGALGMPVPLQVPAPFIRRGARTFTITLTEIGNPANTVTATAKTTALRVTVRPKTARPSSRVRFTGSGFTARKPVYAHYVYYERNPFAVTGADGRLQRTVRLERSSGACGRFSLRRRQIPVAEPAVGYWLIQFDQTRRYATPPKTAFHQLLIRVFQR